MVFTPVSRALNVLYGYLDSTLLWHRAVCAVTARHLFNYLLLREIDFTLTD